MSFGNLITTTAASISSGGTINGSLTIDGDLTVNGDGSGNYDEIVNGNLTISSTNKLVLGGDGSDTYLQESGADVLDIYVGGANMIKLTESTTDTVTVTGALTIGSDGSGHDVIFYSDTAGDNFTWDSSAEKLTITGTNGATALDIADGNLVVADSVDIEGDIDVNGTANLDAVDIDGAVQLDSTLTIGADDQGYDVIFYGDTASSNMTWDTSEDDLVLNDARLYINQDDDAVAIQIDSESAGQYAIDLNAKYGQRIVQDISSGTGLFVTRDIAESGSNPLVLITDNHASNTQPALKVQQDGAGYGINIDQNGNMPAIYIDSEATSQHGIHIDTPATTTGNCLAISNANSLTSGRLAYFYANGTDDTTRNLVEIHNDNSATGATCLKIQQDSTGPALVAMGSVGIGTAAPEAELEILASGTTDLFIRNTTEAVNEYSRLVFLSGSSGAGDTERVATIKALVESDGGALEGQLHFRTNSGDGETTKMTILADGKVGIGVSPNYQMTIAESTSGTNYLQFVNSSTGTGSGDGALIGLDANENLLIWHQESSENITLGTGGSARMVIDDNSRISLSNNDSGADNTIFGFLAGASIGSGHDRNVLIGDYAGTNVAADSNVMIGRACGDAITSGASNVLIGDSALGTATTATQVVAIGSDAMSLVPASQAVTGVVAVGQDALKGAAGTTTGANYSIAIGHSALKALTSGAGNVAIGFEAALAATDNASNTVIGHQAFRAADAGEHHNVIIGNSAGSAINDAGSDKNVIIGKDAGTGGAAAMASCVVIGHAAMDSTAGNAQTGTVAIGESALTALTSGDNNVAMGYEAAKLLTTGEKNVVIGNSAMDAADGSERYNVAIGYAAMGQMDEASNACDYNVAIGASTLTSGANVEMLGNIAIGYETLDGTGTDNQTGTIAIGYRALTALTTGAGNVAIGYQAMDANTTSGQSTAVGYSALGAMTTGGASAGNTAVGRDAGLGITDGIYNTAVGWQAGDTSNATGVTYVGQAAGSIGTGNYCIFVGMGAGESGDNTQAGTIGIGKDALSALTSGQKNIAIGYEALKVHTTGHRNIAIGYGAMNDTDDPQTISSTDNIFIGTDAGGGTWTGSSEINYNVGIGTNVMDAALNGASENTALGYGALSSNTSGDYNVAIGTDAHGGTTAAGCVVIGRQAGNAGLDSDADGFIAIGYQSGIAATSGQGNTAVGFQTLFTNTIGDMNTAVGYQALKTFNTTSDGDGRNTAIGWSSGLSITDAVMNTLVGSHSGDALTTGGQNTVIGATALSVATTATLNTAIGKDAMGDVKAGVAVDSCVAVGHSALKGNSSNSTGINGSTAVGYRALMALTTGAGNTGIGLDAGVSITTGAGNTAVGASALDAADGGESYNVAIGHNAMGDVNHDDADKNVIIGAAAGDEIGANALADTVIIGYGAVSDVATSAASGTVAIGSGALQLLTSGAGNMAVGYQSLDANTVGAYNTALGFYALSANVDGDQNTAVGYNAIANFEAASDGEGDNTAMGYRAGAFLSTGEDNTFIGSLAAQGVTGTRLTGDSNTAVGYSAGLLLQGAAAYNTLIGSQAGAGITTGSSNIAIGFQAADLLTTGGQNIVIGHQAFDAADGTESENVVIGHAAMGGVDEGGGAADSNVCIGYNAGLGGASTEFSSNVAIGAYAFDGSSTQLISNVVAIGKHALGGAIENEGAGTVAIGASALTALTTGARNLAIGYQAADALTTGADNLAIGYSALSSATTNTTQNVAIGNYALNSITAGQTVTDNTAIGYHAGNAITTGDSNTLVGMQAGNVITTGGTNTIIGKDADPSANSATNQIVIGSDTTGVADNSVTLGNASVTDVYMSQDGDAEVHCGTLAVGHGTGSTAGSGVLAEIGDPESGTGGMLFKVLDVPEDTATTFFTIAGSNLWAGIVEITWNASDDTNRSGYQLSRFSYDDTFTSLIASSQNAAPTLSLSGNNMQLELPGAGSSVYRVKIRIMGGRRA